MHFCKNYQCPLCRVAVRFGGTPLEHFFLCCAVNCGNFSHLDSCIVTANWRLNCVLQMHKHLHNYFCSTLVTLFFLFDLVQSTHFKRRNGTFKKRYAAFTSPIEMKYSEDVLKLFKTLTARVLNTTQNNCRRDPELPK